jgi:hypothetical protein
MCLSNKPLKQSKIATIMIQSAKKTKEFQINHLKKDKMKNLLIWNSLLNLEILRISCINQDKILWFIQMPHLLVFNRLKTNL